MIREACGNGSLAVGLALIIMVAGSMVRTDGIFLERGLKSFGVALTATFVLALFLFFMHRKVAYLQQNCMEDVLQGDAERTGLTKT